MAKLFRHLSIDEFRSLSQRKQISHFALPVDRNISVINATLVSSAQKKHAAELRQIPASPYSKAIRKNQIHKQR
jgi:hypothetical protein